MFNHYIDLIIYKKDEMANILIKKLYLILLDFQYTILLFLILSAEIVFGALLAIFREKVGKPIEIDFTFILSANFHVTNSFWLLSMVLI